MDYNLIFDWCRSHWQLILTCILSFTNILICIFKRKVKIQNVDTVFTQLLLILPDLVRVAENKFSEPGSGRDKLSWVLEESLKYICLVSGMSAKDAAGTYGEQIITAIESILESPTKTNKED